MTMLDDDRLASLLGRRRGGLRGACLRRRRHPGPGGAATGPGRRAWGRRATRTAWTTTEGRRRLHPARRATAGVHRLVGRRRPPPRALGGRLHRRRCSSSPARSAALVRSPSAPDRSTSALPRTRARAPPRRPPGPTTTVPPRTRGAGRAPSGTAARAVGAATGRRRAGRGRRAAGHDADRAAPAERRRRPVRQDRADRLAGLTVGRGELGRTMTQLTALAGAYGGFVANSQTQSGAAAGGAPYGQRHAPGPGGQTSPPC